MYFEKVKITVFLASKVLDLLPCNKNGSRKTEGRKMYGYFTNMDEQQLWTGQSSGAVL